MGSKQVSLARFFEDSLEDTARERDMHMLDELRGHCRENEEEAFDDMLANLNSGKYQTLTKAQRDWVEMVCEREGIDTMPRRLRKPVPRGRDVPIAPTLQNPLKPPGRR